MCFFIICLRKVFVKCAPIQSIWRHVLALRHVTFIPWGFWSSCYSWRHPQNTDIFYISSPFFPLNYSPLPPWKVLHKTILMFFNLSSWKILFVLEIFIIILVIWKMGLNTVLQTQSPYSVFLYCKDKMKYEVQSYLLFFLVIVVLLLFICAISNSCLIYCSLLNWRFIQLSCYFPSQSVGISLLPLLSLLQFFFPPTLSF